MRNIVLIATVLVLGSCAYSYTKIDSSNWSEIKANYFSYEITLKAPGGHVQQEKRYSSNSLKGLIVLHYDVLTGPNIYGSPTGETRIYLYANMTNFKNFDEYNNRREELSCEVYKFQEEIRNCVQNKKRYTMYKGEVQKGWHLYIYQEPGNDFTSYDYVKEVSTGKFIEFLGVVSGPAYKREKIRNNRIKMFEDIWKTIKLKAI